MTDFKYVGPPYNLGQCQEQSFSTTVSCKACLDPFDVDDPPVPFRSSTRERHGTHRHS